MTTLGKKFPKTVDIKVHELPGTIDNKKTTGSLQKHLNARGELVALK